MKKTIAVVLVLLMVLTLAACGGEKTTAPETAGSNETAQTPSESGQPDSGDEQGEAAAVSEDWPTDKYPQPENCEIAGPVDYAAGTMIRVNWNDLDAAKAYKKVVGQLGEFGTIEANDEETFYAFQGVGIRISYDAENADNNYVVIME